MTSTRTKSALLQSLAGIIVLSMGAMLLTTPLPAWSQSVRARDETARIVTIEKITVADSVVSGEVFNRSSNNVRDVQLLIRYTWLWDNETKPGTDDPGTSTYYTLPKEIAPGARLPFSFKPSPPLPQVTGGHFETSVAIAGFTEVIQQTR